MKNIEHIENIGLGGLCVLCARGAVRPWESPAFQEPRPIAACALASEPAVYSCRGLSERLSMSKTKRVGAKTLGDASPQPGLLDREDAVMCPLQAWSTGGLIPRFDRKPDELGGANPQLGWPCVAIFPARYVFV